MKQIGSVRFRLGGMFALIIVLKAGRTLHRYRGEGTQRKAVAGRVEFGPLVRKEWRRLHRGAQHADVQAAGIKRRTSSISVGYWT
jgi:hypothetical protein